MTRLLPLFLSLLLVAPVATAQPRRHRAPPAKGHHKGHHKDHGKHKGHNKGKDHPGKGPKKHRAPPAEPEMPVRKPVRLQGFAPQKGTPGTVVTIRGAEMDNTVRVRFNGRWLRVMNRGGNHVSVRIPGNAVTDSFVISKAGFGDQTMSPAFIVIRAPVIRSFTPQSGRAGTNVTVRGEHFIAGDNFLLGERPLKTLSVRHNLAVVTIPRHATTARIGVRRGPRTTWSRRPFQVELPQPVVTGFSPTQGPRGTVVRINGRHFGPADTVLLGGRPVTIRGRSRTHFDVVIGRNHTGRFTVQDRRGRRAVSAGLFTVVRPPKVAGFSPRFGPPGTQIIVTGHGFINGDQVLVGGGMLTVRSVNDRRIVATLPAGVNSGPVVVQRGGRRFRARGGIFEVVHPPVITDIQPRAAAPNSLVTIRGRHFTPAATVVLSGMRLPIVRRAIPHELTVKIPAGARPGNIVVVTRGGSARSSIVFRIRQRAQLTSFFPLHGLPGSQVTLNGHHFHPGMRVQLNGMELPRVSTAPRKAVVTIPRGARSGRIVVTSYGEASSSRMVFTVDKPRPAVEFTFTPMAGRRGSDVTLLLTPPHPRAMVIYDGRPLPKRTLQGGRRIVVTVPGDARTGYFEIEVNGQRYRAKRPFRVR